MEIYSRWAAFYYWPSWRRILAAIWIKPLPSDETKEDRDRFSNVKADYFRVTMRLYDGENWRNEFILYEPHIRGGNVVISIPVL